MKQYKTKQARLIRSERGKPRIKISFTFDNDILNKVRALPNRRYHNEGNKDKYWTCTMCVEAVKSLQGWGFALDEELRDFVMSKKLNVQSLEEIEVPGLKMQLYPFQKKGVAFIEAKEGRVLIGDEMGLGKTAQALAWLHLHPEKRPVVIVVPASLKLNWKREAEMWLPNPKVQILHGTRPDGPITGDLIVINYDILHPWLFRLLDLRPQVLITDECHYWKNSKAKRTLAVKRLGKHIPHILALSGTPIINRPIEFYNAIKLIDPAIVPNKWDYGFKYCGGHHNGFSWDFNGASNTEELHALLTNTIMIRRKKEHVLSELPPKVRSIVPMGINNREKYQDAERDFLLWVAETKGVEAARKASNAEAFTKVEALKQIAVRGKIDNCIQWIKDFLEVEDKLVVFATHRFTIDTLMDAFKVGIVRVDGTITGGVRDEAVRRFQEEKTTRLFVGNIKAAGVGITLTAASTVAFLELGWSPGEHDQAEDRIHRIGQEAESINIYYLLATDTIEEKIARLLDHKRKVVNRVLDGVGTEEESLLWQLLKEYK
jgi:SWI/SNF-related matrix-associated actin-dependent regulator of chromatin subfamily A-like protein 1